ncbi:ethanolamine utilization protein [Escherichia coli]|nr:ethanolamine utilization protein [Escherichia coli]
MKRIAFVGSVGAGKTTLFNAFAGELYPRQKNTGRGI